MRPLLKSSLDALGFVQVTSRPGSVLVSRQSPNDESVAAYFHFSLEDSSGFSTSILIASSFVFDCGKRFDLSYAKNGIPLPSGKRGTGVLAVDLKWLTWNIKSDTNEYQPYYEFEANQGRDEVLYEIQTVGKAFYEPILQPLVLARFLESLASYPINSDCGGKPRSADPSLYAAMLLIQCGRSQEAKNVLGRGRLKYEEAGFKEYWQRMRYQMYCESTRAILSLIK